VQSVARELKCCGLQKGPDFKRVNLPWVAIQLSTPQNLTHEAGASGPIWLCAFGPVVLYGCTPLGKSIYPACLV